MRITTCLFLLFSVLLMLSCVEEPKEKPPVSAASKEKVVPSDEFRVESLFSGDLADGFVWPAGKEKAIISAARGKVVVARNTGSALGNVICIGHRFVENAKIREVYSVYAGLAEINVEKGDMVSKKQTIGKADYKPLRFVIAADSLFTKYFTASDTSSVLTREFIKRHASMLIPAKEAFLLVAVKHEYKMQSFAYGKLLKTYDIALSQSPLGHKQMEGDNKLPEGEYRIIQKTKGPFAGDYAEYLGPRFMRLNYPNNYDAENALKNKKINARQAAQIINANNAKKEPNKYTGLGGGIGIHGWAGDWPSDSRHLTWGCISMKNAEITGLFDTVPLYTQILIFP